jgi:hypothetical protein
MIFPIIIAIWFGYLAMKFGRNIILWALGGAILTFVVNTILANFGILLVTGSLAGPIEYDTNIMIRIITAILTIVIVVNISIVSFRPIQKQEKLVTSEFSGDKFKEYKKGANQSNVIDEQQTDNHKQTPKKRQLNRTEEKVTGYRKLGEEDYTSISSDEIKFRHCPFCNTDMISTSDGRCANCKMTLSEENMGK